MDPTDLLALPALAVPWLLLGTTYRQTRDRAGISSTVVRPG
jgi:hypothetical protein